MSASGTIRAAFAGYNLFSSCAEVLAKHSRTELVAVLTGEATHPVDGVLEIAKEHGAETFLGKPTPEVVEQLNALRIDLVVAAVYAYRVPVRKLTATRKVNIHPSLLPHGKGATPLPYLVDTEKSACGLTLHEMTHEFDAGPILLQQPIPVGEDDGIDEVALAMFGAAPRLLEQYLDHYEEYETGTPQGPGSYWPPVLIFDRMLDAAAATVREARSLARKMGFLGVILVTDQGAYRGTRFTMTECEHGFEPGSVVARWSSAWTIALTDGLVRVYDPVSARQ